jgi:hypothetical protein
MHIKIERALLKDKETPKFTVLDGVDFMAKEQS